MIDEMSMPAALSLSSLAKAEVIKNREIDEGARAPNDIVSTGH